MFDLSKVPFWVYLLIAAVVITLVTVLKRKKGSDKGREDAQKVRENTKVGSKVVLMSGIYGTVVKLTDDIAEVEIAEGVVVKTRRYSIMGSQAEFAEADRKRKEEENKEKAKA